MGIETRTEFQIKKVEFQVIENGENTDRYNKGVLMCDNGDNMFVVRFADTDKRILFTAAYTMLQQLELFDLKDEFSKWLDKMSEK